MESVVHVAESRVERERAAALPWYLTAMLVILFESFFRECERKS